MESRDNDAILWLSACDEEENDCSSKQPKPLLRKCVLFFRNRPNEAKENLFLPQQPPVQEGVGAAWAPSWVFTPTSPHLGL